MPAVDYWYSSELNDEWLETEKKLQTIKRLIAVPPLKS